MDSRYLVPLAATYLGVVLGLCTWTDLSRRIIPNRANVFLLAGALAFTLADPSGSIGAALIGAAIGGLSFFIIAMAFRYLHNRDGLGLGDVKFMLGAGAWVGWQGVAPLVLIASLTALLYVIGRRFCSGSFDATMRIPFAPFLSLATLLVWSVQVTEVMPWISPLH